MDDEVLYEEGLRNILRKRPVSSTSLNAIQRGLLERVLGLHKQDTVERNALTKWYSDETPLLNNLVERGLLGFDVARQLYYVTSTGLTILESKRPILVGRIG